MATPASWLDKLQIKPSHSAVNNADEEHKKIITDYLGHKLDKNFGPVGMQDPVRRTEFYSEDGRNEVMVHFNNKGQKISSVAQEIRDELFKGKDGKKCYVIGSQGAIGDGLNISSSSISINCECDFKELANTIKRNQKIAKSSWAIH